MKKHLLLTLAATVALAGVLRADDTMPAAASATAATAAPAKMDAKSDTTPAAVAKNDAPGSLKAGNQLLGDGKYAEAVAYFEGIGEQVEANGKAKREPYRLLGLSTAYIGLNQYKEAEDAAQKAIDLSKDLESAWANLAVAQCSLEGRTKAMDTLTKGIAALQADKVDTAKLDANLKILQIEADKAKAKADKKAGKKVDAMGSTPAASAPAAAPMSPAAAAK